jgi:hypothetical protein
MSDSNSVPLGLSLGTLSSGPKNSASGAARQSRFTVDESHMASQDVLDLNAKASDSQQNPENFLSSGFSIARASKNFLKGVVSPLTALIQHPVMAIGALALGIAACTMVPALVPVMVVGFGGLSLYQGAKGTLNAVQHYQKGDYQ